MGGHGHRPGCAGAAGVAGVLLPQATASPPTRNETGHQPETHATRHPRPPWHGRARPMFRLSCAAPPRSSGRPSEARLKDGAESYGSALDGVKLKIMNGLCSLNVWPGWTLLEGREIAAAPGQDGLRGEPRRRHGRDRRPVDRLVDAHADLGPALAGPEDGLEGHDRGRGRAGRAGGPRRGRPAGTTAPPARGRAARSERALVVVRDDERARRRTGRRARGRSGGGRGRGAALGKSSTRGTSTPKAPRVTT